MKKSVSFISVVAYLLLAFGTFSAYSVDDNETGETCEKKFTVKPKKVRRLSPEDIGLLSKETLYSLRPKHLFLSFSSARRKKIRRLEIDKRSVSGFGLRQLAL